MSNNSIKHVNFSGVDYFQPKTNGGGSTKFHKEVNNSFITELVESIEVIESDIKNNLAITSIPYVAAIVELENSAISKSNRPNKIFDESTCPFFGDIGFSKFLIRASSHGLKKLKQKVNNASGKSTLESELSAVSSIRLFKPQVKIVEDSQVNSYVIRLLRFDEGGINSKIDSEFECYLNRNSYEWSKHSSEAIRIYKVRLDEEHVNHLCENNVFIQSISPSKSVSILKHFDNEHTNASIDIGYPDEDSPVVGIIDSAISPHCEPLLPWIEGVKTIVDEDDSFSEHGTFVAGLISSGKLLNNGDLNFPNCRSKIFGIEAIGKNGGDYYEILHTMDSVAQDHPNIKVWNLSIGDGESVSIYNISEFGILLDEFQDKHNCLCIVAAGNYENLRSWPPEDGIDYQNRICSPGDSVRAITVGSISHTDGFVKYGEPSSFSRRGPVSNFVQKPEISHFGGNLLKNGEFSINTSVKSLCPLGNSTYDIGTSFAAPTVSSLAANLFSKLGDRASPSLVKGLLIHSANLNSNVNKQKKLKDYCGWGVPADINEILDVKDYETTLVFQGVAKKSFEVQKLPFPIPECLRTEDGKVRGEFYITLTYQPELDARKSFEYCQVDLSVGLGKTDGISFASKVPLQTSTPRFEEDLTKSGDKWSPVKVYHKAFPRGTDIEKWKLRVAVLDRDGYDATDVEIPFSIILTIRDIDQEKPVYNEMARLMEQYNWEVSDLAIEPRIKL